MYTTRHFGWRRVEHGVQCLPGVCQGGFDSLDLGDMRRFLDDAAGEGGPRALLQGRHGSRHAQPAREAGLRCGGGLRGAALPRGGAGCRAGALSRLALGQAGESHGGVDLPPALAVFSWWVSAPQLAPVHKQPVRSR